MIVTDSAPRERRTLDELIAAAEAETQDASAVTYADQVQVGCKAFEIGLWELSRDNHTEARYWLQTAVDAGIAEARPLLVLCTQAADPQPDRDSVLDDEPHAGPRT